MKALDPKVSYFMDLEATNPIYDPEIEAAYRIAQVCQAAMESLPKPNSLHQAHTIFRDQHKQRHSGLELTGSPMMPHNSQVAMKLPLNSTVDRQINLVEATLAIRTWVSPKQAMHDYLLLDTSAQLAAFGLTHQWLLRQILSLLEASLTQAPQQAIDKLRNHLVANPQLLNPEIAIIVSA